ncbi:MAG: cell division protein ZapE, partial [Pseudolabrys sp.]
MPAQFRARYAALVSAGEIEVDPGQASLVARLARLEQQLALHRQLRKSSPLGWLLARRPQTEEPRRGLY